MKTAILALTLVAGAASAQTVTFQAVPSPALSANDITPDGRYIVGEISYDGFTVAGTYVWDRLTDAFTIMPPEGVDASAISDDGTIVLGTIAGENSPLGDVAARWTAETGWQSIGHLPNAGECPSLSNGYELSADGSVAVGLSWSGCSGRGFVWRAETGMQELQVLASGGNRASVVSADGTVIAGFAQGNFSRTPAIWNGVTRTGEVLDPNFEGEFTGMSPDGSVLLGTMYMGGSDGSYDAVKWTSAGGFEIIGAGAKSFQWAGEAMAVSNDGTIVGFDYRMGNRRAWIQPGGIGDLDFLDEWAVAHGAEVPIALEVAQSITPNGRVIIGHTYGSRAWIMTIGSTCLADFDGDGFVSGLDYDLYVGAFEAGVMSADIDGDGFITGLDFDSYVVLFEAGC